jgi:hypothetical protein
MDIFSKIGQKVQTTVFPTGHVTTLPLDSQVESLVQHYLSLWWASERSLPAFPVTYSPAQQSANDQKMERLVGGLIHEVKQMPAAVGKDRQDGEARQAMQGRLRSGAMDFARDALGFEQRHLDFLETSGIIEAVQEFARMARRFDPHISGDDIYQAARNVMSMNFIQLLLGLPVKVTPSVFAYSALYPYTDNYLDDPSVPRTTKLAFNHRFQARLKGEMVRPANPNEEIISNLVGMIEGEWDRTRYPLVYDSLLAIHAAQARSLKLVAPGASPYELDVLGISFEKGGTSVLADGYLIAGWLNPQQLTFLFGYGAFTQLMDDLEDVTPDLKEGRLSIFSQLANRWPLDHVTSQAFHFGRSIFSDLSAFTAPATAPLSDLIARAIDPVMVDTIGRVGGYYSKDYLREMERHMPFHFASLRKQRERLERQKVSLAKLVDGFFIE